VGHDDNYTSTFPYAFLVSCLIMHKNNFTQCYRGLQPLIYYYFSNPIPKHHDGMACKDIKVKLQTFLILELDGDETASISGYFASWK
jgi:hypothetical protein